MSKVVRFRTLKHGDPPKFKVLPEDLQIRSRRTGSDTSIGSFPIMILGIVAIAIILVIFGLLG